MRNAYALLGLAFLLVFAGAYLVVEKVHAPEPIPVSDIFVISESATMALTLSSSAFADGGMIPVAYTCDGVNTPPPLSISGVPEGTVALALVMDDPDIPPEIKTARDIEKFNHWSVYNLPATTAEITTDIVGITTGVNSSGMTAYTGPCPPPEYKPTTHRYIFRLYALSEKLQFSESPTLDEVEQAAVAVSLASTTLMGRYTRVAE